MPPKKVATENGASVEVGGTTLSARDMEILTAAMKSNKAGLEVSAPSDIHKGATHTVAAISKKSVRADG
jgi:hypothetical protein